MTVDDSVNETTPGRIHLNVHERASSSVLLLISDGPLAWCVANRLSEKFDNITIVQEQPETKVEILRRRARLLGWPTAFGQAVLGIVMRVAKLVVTRRRDAIQGEYALRPIPDSNLRRYLVPSVNSAECRSLIASLSPNVIAVYGTRMLNALTLESITVPCINYHAGITPRYRGQNPAYWALVNGDAKNAGVTVHLVDTGVDTGDVLYQKTVSFDARDTILTYHWVQLAEALPLFEQAIDDAINSRLAPRHLGRPSQIFFPPTIWGYIGTGLTKGVW